MPAAAGPGSLWGPLLLPRAGGPSLLAASAGRPAIAGFQLLSRLYTYKHQQLDNVLEWRKTHSLGSAGNTERQHTANSTCRSHMACTCLQGRSTQVTGAAACEKTHFHVQCQTSTITVHCQCGSCLESVRKLVMAHGCTARLVPPLLGPEVRSSEATDRLCLLDLLLYVQSAPLPVTAQRRAAAPRAPGQCSFARHSLCSWAARHRPRWRAVCSLLEPDTELTPA